MPQGDLRAGQLRDARQRAVRVRRYSGHGKVRDRGRGQGGSADGERVSADVLTAANTVIERTAGRMKGGASHASTRFAATTRRAATGSVSTRWPENACRFCRCAAMRWSRRRLWSWSCSGWLRSRRTGTGRAAPSSPAHGATWNRCAPAASLTGFRCSRPSRPYRTPGACERHRRRWRRCALAGSAWSGTRRARHGSAELQRPSAPSAIEGSADGRTFEVLYDDSIVRLFLHGAVEGSGHLDRPVESVLPPGLWEPKHAHLDWWQRLVDSRVVNCRSGATSVGLTAFPWESGSAEGQAAL